MESLRNTERLTARRDAAVAEIENLDRAVAAAKTEWEAAVVSEDRKAETDAAKKLDAADRALATAKGRLPLLQRSVRDTLRAALPAHAAETAAILEAHNAEARDLGKALIKHYEVAREWALRINALHAAHTAAVRAHVDLCRDATGNIPHAPIEPIPHDGHFAVSVSELNRTFKPDANERFRLTSQGLLGAPAPEGDDDNVDE